MFAARSHSPHRAPPARRRLSIETRLILLHLLVLCSLTLVLAVIQVGSLQKAVRQELGERALSTSRLVALLPEVVRGARAGTQDARLNAFVNRLREKVGADFIVVGDRRGVRLAHPQPDRLGKPMEGGDNAAPLAGRDIVSVARGSLGWSVRGKVPVLGADGTVVGAVSTGYLMPRVDALAGQAVRELMPWFVVALLVGVLGAVAVARLLKRAILNLEPHQIAALVHQQRGVLAALREGVLAVGPDGRVTLTNARAADLLRLAPGTPGVRVEDAWPELAAVAGSAARHNLELRFGDHPVLVNVEPLQGGGYVASVRDRAEVLALAEELTQVRGFVAVLRAQSHEYLNRLHTISGLIQLGRAEDALRVVHAEVEADATLRALMRDLHAPRLVALLMGKRERAGELGVAFHVEAGSNLSPAWDRAADVLVTVVGNLTENAFEALGGRGGNVRVSIGEDPDGLQVEVLDDGPGVPPEWRDRVFEPGVTTRGEGRGTGLALVRTRVEAFGGDVRHFRRGPWTVFQVNLPHTGAGTDAASGDRADGSLP